MIEIEHLTKRYGDMPAVNDVSMRLEAGTITVIVGASGSGKSTLLRLVNRLIEADAGAVRFNGVSWQDIPLVALRRRIGYVIQDHGLFPHWTVSRNIATVPRLLGWSAPRIEARVREVLGLLQLDYDTFAYRFPHELSGGQAQRVGVARALAADPDVLLMDEPFGALDPVIRQRAQRELAAIHRQIGSTILMVTHDMAEAMLMADRIAVMDGGFLVQLGTPVDIVARPASPFVRSLVAEGERAFRHLSLMPLGPLVRSGEARGAPVRIDTSLSAVLSEMIWSGRAMLPVMNETAERVGVVALADVLRAGRAP